MDATEYRRLVATLSALLIAILIGAAFAVATLRGARAASNAGRLSPAVIADGPRIFRFETFGDEDRWTDQLRMHTVVETCVDPTTVLAGSAAPLQDVVAHSDQVRTLGFRSPPKR